MKGRTPSITVCLMLILALFAGLDLSLDIVPKVGAGTIYVPTDYPTIQEAVDAAWTGDTVYVYSGSYTEYVVVNKALNLIGEDRDNTWIWGGSGDHALRITAGGVYITGFGISSSCPEGAGIHLEVGGNTIYGNSAGGDYGIDLSSSWGNIIENNIVGGGVGIRLESSPSNTVQDNTIGGETGILLDGSDDNTITGNTISCYGAGIMIATSKGNTIKSNTISNNFCGIYFLLGSGQGNIVTDNAMSNNENGVSYFWSDGSLTNCSITGSSNYDFYLETFSHGTALNTNFNKAKTYFAEYNMGSTLTVKWYLHVSVKDELGNPVPNANIKIEDNENGSYSETFTADGNGHLRWIPVTEYVEQDTDGDTNGEKTFYTPHRIIAWKDTLVGYSQPIIDESKTVTIVLYTGTLVDLEPNWNLISPPRIQSDPNLPTVLQSIEGRYDAVQWYNITDTGDQWKHHHISKPSDLNDLDKIDHTMGLWVHNTDPRGTTLVVFGDVLTSSQSIKLYPGWNLVGFPSKTNKTRDIALGTLYFGTDVDSIWTYNSTTQQWVELDEPTDYFEVGLGYWIHSKVTKVWNVPL